MLSRRTAAIICAAQLASFAALAQAPNSPYTAGPHAPVPAQEQESAPSAAPVPVIYFVDSRGLVGRIRLGPYVLRFIGYAQADLTDIAFNPVDHKLYGVSFTSLYEVSTHTGRATFLGSLGVKDANALVFDSAGQAYSAGETTGRLYKIDLKTAKASVVGRMGGYKSVGDLAFYNGRLTLTGYWGAPPITSGKRNYLVTLDQTTGAVIGKAIPIGSREVFGLVSTAPNELWGLGLRGSDFTNLYKLLPDGPTGGRDRLVYHVPDGVKHIYGAAYDGNYQP